MRFHLASSGNPRNRRWFSRRRTRVAVAAASTLAAVVAPVTAAGPGPGGPRVPVPAWHRCASGFECATAHVQLDYRHLHGATISLLVFRHRQLHATTIWVPLHLAVGLPPCVITQVRRL